jgi:hypothetical protein
LDHLLPRLDHAVEASVEYAHSATPHLFARRVLPERWKLPADFFTYQFINLDERTQLLLTDVKVSGQARSEGAPTRAEVISSTSIVCRARNVQASDG